MKSFVKLGALLASGGALVIATSSAMAAVSDCCPGWEGVAGMDCAKCAVAKNGISCQFTCPLPGGCCPRDGGLPGCNNSAGDCVEPFGCNNGGPSQ